MSNLALERRASKRKALTTFNIPPRPRLPAWFVSKFKLEDWQSADELWRQQLESNLREALQSVKVE